MDEEELEYNAMRVAQANQALRMPEGNYKQQLIQRLATLHNEYIPTDDEGRPMDIRSVTQRMVASLAPRKRAAALARKRARNKERLSMVLETKHRGADYTGRTKSPRFINSMRVKNLLGEMLGTRTGLASGTRRKRRKKSRNSRRRKRQTKRRRRRRTSR